MKDVSPPCGQTEFYPSSPAPSAENGSNTVADYITASYGQGSIGYDEYAYALSSGYPVVQLLNPADYFVGPTASNVAVALTKAQIDEDNTAPNFLQQDLDSVYTFKDPRAYPLSSYSYLIVPRQGATTANVLQRQRRPVAQPVHRFLPVRRAETDARPRLLSAAVQPRQGRAPAGKQIPGHVTPPNIKNYASCGNPTFKNGKNVLLERALPDQVPEARRPAQLRGEERQGRTGAGRRRARRLRRLGRVREGLVGRAAAEAARAAGQPGDWGVHRHREPQPGRPMCRGASSTWPPTARTGRCLRCSPRWPWSRRSRRLPPWVPGCAVARGRPEPRPGHPAAGNGEGIDDRRGQRAEPEAAGAAPAQSRPGPGRAASGRRRPRRAAPAAAYGGRGPTARQHRRGHRHRGDPARPAGARLRRLPVLLSGVQEARAQTTMYATLRGELAAGRPRSDLPAEAGHARGDTQHPGHRGAQRGRGARGPARRTSNWAPATCATPRCPVKPGWPCCTGAGPRSARRSRRCRSCCRVTRSRSRPARAHPSTRSRWSATARNRILINPAPNQLMLLTADSDFDPQPLHRGGRHPRLDTRGQPRRQPAVSPAEVALGNDPNALIPCMAWGLALVLVSVGGTVAASWSQVAGVPGHRPDRDGRHVEPLREHRGAAAQPLLIAEAMMRHSEWSQPVSDPTQPQDREPQPTPFAPPGRPVPTHRTSRAPGPSPVPADGTPTGHGRRPADRLHRLPARRRPHLGSGPLVGLEARNVSAWFG